jgi:hypothetical protein
LHGLARHRVRKAEQSSVQPWAANPRQSGPGCSQLAGLGVAVVAEHRVADGGKVHSHLVGAAGPEAARHKGDRDRRRGTTFSTVVRESLAATLDDRHFHPVRLGAAEGGVDGTFVCFELPVDDREVRPFHGPSGQLGHEALAGLRCTCYDHQPGRPLVETLDNARALVLGADGGYLWEKNDKLLNKGPLEIASAGVYHQASGLVHYYQVFVGEDDRSFQERPANCGRRRGPVRLYQGVPGQVHFQQLATSEAPATCTHDRSRDPHPALFYQA